MQSQLNYDDYQIQLQQNRQAFDELLKKVRPDLMAMVELLDRTGMNIFILLKIARQLHMIDSGTGYGEVSVLIEDHVVRFVNGLEKDRLNEPIIMKKEEQIVQEG